MDAEDFHETYISGTTELELDSGSFETITGTVTDTGYEVTFSEVDLDTWMDFESLLGIDEADGMECTTFELTGAYVLDQNYVPISEVVDLTFGYSIMGTEILETVTINLKVNDSGDTVSVSLGVQRNLQW